ncbi:unnamed protein product [Paramecium sonneborni]|uniref:CRAL-TRIO domain-containing protein n=1 Tax=Paramecium sonneborni TaxID=65129 RepID=A0A8S1QPW2_9CILI|nr:unnamed protein product [Paramecium sonneborni]
MFQDRFSNLIASQNEIAALSIDSNYIKTGSLRRIFKNVQYDTFENQQLKEFKAYLDSIPVEYLKEVQNDSVLLRFLYAHKFVKEDTVNYFVDHLNWLNHPETMNLDDIPQYSKLVQIIGRDEMLRPVLHISLSLPLDDLFIKAITNKLIIMEDYMFVPGKVESWIVIVDLSQTNQNTKPEKIQSAIKSFVTNFPMSLEHIYFLEANLILRQIGENVLKQNEIKKLNFDDKITITDKAKYEKEKLQFLSPEYVHLFENEQLINQSLQNQQNAFSLFQQQGSQSSFPNAQSPNQIQHIQPNQSNLIGQQPVQLILNQPQPTLYGNPSKPQNGGELIGPLYPMVVYASAQPQPYVPDYHNNNKEFQIQPAIQRDPNLIMNNLQNNYPNIILNNQNIVKTSPPQQQLGVETKTDYLVRTKYDDIIDQYNWNKYGVTQQLPSIEPEKIINDVTMHISSPLQQYTPLTPTLQGIQQTVKKNDFHLNHDIYSTYNNHFEDPILNHNKDHFPQISEHPSQNNFHYDNPHDPLNKYTKIDLPLDPISSFPQSNHKYDYDPLPYQPHQKIDSYRSPIHSIDSYTPPPIHHQIEKKYDFGPIPNRPSEHSFPNSQIIYDKPFIPDRSSLDTPITTINYTQPKYQSYVPQTMNNNNNLNSLPSNLQTIPLSTIPQNSGYSPYQPQQPFSPIPSSTNLYTAPNYPIPTNKPQSTLEQPKIVEQDGIKFQDETMVVGDNDHRQTKNSNRDPVLNQQQCSIQ